MATTPLWHSQVDKSLKAGATPDAMRKKLEDTIKQNNSVVAKSALSYLNGLHPVNTATPAPYVPPATNLPYINNPDGSPVTSNQTPQYTPSAAPPPPVNTSGGPSQGTSGYSLGESTSSNSQADRLYGTMDAYADNAKKTAADTEANARKFGNEQQTVTVQRDADKLARAIKEEADLLAIKNRAEGNVEQRRKDAENLVKKQEEIAAMNSNMAMADAGKSGLQISQGDLTTIQNDVMNKYASNIANAMDFQNKTNMSLDDALTRTGLEIFSQQGEINKFKDLLQDNKYAPILEAIKQAATGNQKAIDDVSAFYQEYAKKKTDGEYSGFDQQEVVSAKEDAFQKASLAKKENMLMYDLKEIPGAAYIGSEVGRVLTKYPNESRTFITGELAKLAMQNADARAQILQAIAVGQKVPAFISDEVNKQTGASVGATGATDQARINSEAAARAANPVLNNNNNATPAAVTSNATVKQLSQPNKDFLAQMRTNAKKSANPQNVINNAIVMLKHKLSAGSIDQGQYDMVYAELSKPL